MPVEPVELLQQLVAIPSVNPLGRHGDGQFYGEARLTEFLQALCERLGWRWLRQEVHPGRENLLASIPGSPSAGDGGELILWDAHQDTVDVNGMSVDPFGGEVRDGRIYGRGTSDDKGPMAAMIAALSRLETPPADVRPNIVIAFPVNEECGFTGAKAMCEVWSSDRSAGTHPTSGTISPTEMFPRPPDAAIVAEPTDLNVVVAHQGVVRWRCHASGRAAHSSRPDEGINAIYAMSRVAQAIEKYQAHLAANAEVHPLCGRPAACVTTIDGGVGINTVPDRATITIDRRTAPHESPAAARDELIRFISERADIAGERLHHDPPFMVGNGLADADNRQLAEQIVQIVRERGKKCDIVGAPYGTDAAAIAATAVPTVVFGPGSVRQAHTADEFIAVSDVEFGADIFQRLACSGLRPRKRLKPN